MNRITVAELEWLLERGAVDLVDVRSEKEFRKVHALGARSVPLSEFGPHLVAVHRGKEAPLTLCLMCDRTLRASLAAGLITGSGAADPRVLEGGLQAWINDGLPVVEQAPLQVISRLVTRLADWVGTAVAHWQQRLRLRPA